MLTILTGDAVEKLRGLPAESVQCCVTSPPYWGLRDYGTASWEGGDDGCDHKQPPKGGHGEKSLIGKGERDIEIMSSQQYFRDCGKCGARRIDSQLGLEKTPEEYVAKMVEVFREVRRVLLKDGTLWLNLGDSYHGSWANYGGSDRGAGKQRLIKHGSSAQNPVWDGLEDWRPPASFKHDTLKPKDLCGIPWRVAFALQSDGWYLRQDIIWAKPNPMPESVTDRCTKSHEYLFLLTKNVRYFYDNEAIREQVKDSCDGTIRARARTANGALGGENQHNIEEREYDRICGANKRSVWTVATAPYPEAHFATYPPDLIKPCIMAGTSAKGCCAKCGAPWERIVESEQTGDQRWSKNGGLHRADVPGSVLSPSSVFRTGSHNVNKTIGWQQTCKCVGVIAGMGAVPCTVLDPFAGSGTTGMVSLELGRKAILIELNPKYVELIEQRCNVTVGLPL